MRYFLSTVYFLFILFIGNAQSTRQTQQCATSAYMEQMFQQNPNWKERFDALSKPKENILFKNSGSGNFVNSTVTIPVVVHIVHNVNVPSISDAQVFSQIAVLNADYSGMNSDTTIIPNVWKSLKANVQVQFCLAQRDPLDNPTTGITRTATTTTSFGLNNAMKFTSQGGEDAWDASRFLNIWVCPLSSNLLGYAQFPGGSPSTDGVVILDSAFGKVGAIKSPYNKGRTATHEVGHWLSLIHIWGDDGDANSSNNNTTSFCSGSDHVSDTPNASEETYGSPSFPQLDGCQPTSPGKMFYDYMDYSDDNKLVMFTWGQSLRMNIALDTLRSTLKTSNGCVAVGIRELGSYSIPFDLYPNPSSGIIYLSPLTYLGNIEVSVLNTLGQPVFIKSFSSVDMNNQLPIDLTTVANGLYILQVHQKNNQFYKKIKIVH